MGVARLAWLQVPPQPPGTPLPAPPPPPLALAQVPYRDDPTIFAWAVTGEPIPDGRNRSHPVGPRESRDADNVVRFVLNAASLLKAAGVLISTGGLLHMDEKLKVYKGSVPYSVPMWRNSNISFASVHVYYDVHTDWFKAPFYLN